MNGQQKTEGKEEIFKQTLETKIMSKTIPVARKKDLVIQELDGEILIYDLQNNRVFGLNQTSALIWQLSNGEKNITEIAVEASRTLNSPVSEEFVWFALEKLERQNLVENISVEPSPFKGMKRREVIRKVGLSSLVALPVIMSLTTPVAAQSASSAACAVTSCNCTIMFSSPMTTCSSIADCMTDTLPTCMCNSLTCTGSGPGNVSCSGVCGS